MAKRSKGKRARELRRALASPVVYQEPVLVFEGESFRVADRVGLMPLLKFAHLAKTGVDAGDLDGLVAIYDLLRNVIADSEPDEKTGLTEWDRFEMHATVKRSTGDELMEVVGQAIELITERPTSRPSDSSAGSLTMSPSSPDDSSSRVIHRLEAEGRPSIAYMVRQAQEAGSRASA